MAKTMIPDRGDDPKRKMSYSDMSVNKLSPSGGYEISHMDSGYRTSKKYYGYSKKSAMKKHKDQFESGK